MLPVNLRVSVSGCRPSSLSLVTFSSSQTGFGLQKRHPEMDPFAFQFLQQVNARENQQAHPVNNTPCLCSVITWSVCVFPPRNRWTWNTKGERDCKRKCWLMFGWLFVYLRWFCMHSCTGRGDRLVPSSSAELLVLSSADSTQLSAFIYAWSDRTRAASKTGYFLSLSIYNCYFLFNLPHFLTWGLGRIISKLTACLLFTDRIDFYTRCYVGYNTAAPTHNTQFWVNASHSESKVLWIACDWQSFRPIFKITRIFKVELGRKKNTLSFHMLLHTTFHRGDFQPWGFVWWSL